MDYGMMKTKFMSYAEAHKIEPALSDFAESITWAELFLAASLPQDVVSELSVVYSADVLTEAPRSINLPSDLIRIESVRLALTRSGEAPVYLPCVMVDPASYLAKVQYSDDLIASVFNNRLNVNPDPAAESSGYPGSIELSYRRKPVTYITDGNGIHNGVFITTLDTAGSRLYSTETFGATLEAYLDVTKLNGGKLVYGVTSNTVANLDIEAAFNDDTNSFTYIVVKDNYYTPAVDLDNVYIHEKYFSGGTGVLYRGDLSETDFDEHWHGLLVDLAIGRYLIGVKPEVEKYLQLAFSVLQRYGVSLPFGYGGEK